LDVFNSLINYDKQLLLFLHSKGYSAWDSFWVFITNPLHWIPVFFILFYFCYKVFAFKKASFAAIYTALSATTSLVVVNLIKNNIQRLRPINDVSVNDSIRVLIEANDFSFVSGHSTVSFTIAFISFWTLKKYYSFSFTIFIFPILFAYSRIYLAVHYPLDILSGMILGYLIAFGFYKLMNYFVLKH
jgi:undecaprenyl-diphosphatase